MSKNKNAKPCPADGIQGFKQFLIGNVNVRMGSTTNLNKKKTHTRAKTQVIKNEDLGLSSKQSSAQLKLTIKPKKGESTIRLPSSKASKIDLKKEKAKTEVLET